MSLRSRARALQHAMGISYQKALEKIRALGNAPAELARKTGWPLKDCDAHLLAPRPSVRVDVSVNAKTLSEACERLRITTDARAVCIIDQRRALAMSGVVALHLLALRQEDFRIPGLQVFSCPLVNGAKLVVLFDEKQTSLGIVRLRARAAAREIDRILGEPKLVPPTSGNSGSGAPAQISAFDGLFDRLGKLGGSKPS